MATVTVSKGFSFATVRSWWNNLDNFGSFEVLATSSSKLSVMANGEILTLNGSGFTYPSGILNSGTVTSIEYTTIGSSAYKVTGLSLNAKTLVGKAINGSTDSVYSYAFSGNDVIIGSGSNDVLKGYAGNDLLRGNAGKDSLTGGSGADKFRFDKALSSSNIDTIKDFKAIDDTIQIDNAVFKKLTATGMLKAANFKASTSGNAADSNDFILYEIDTGKLFYDADGNGSGAKVQFALLGSATHPAITAADFSVI